jgi:Zn-dependent protease with chaperone function
MRQAQAIYFDGRVGRRHKVDVIVTGGRLKVVGSDVDGDFRARRVRVSPRIGKTPRWLYLPNGGACEVDDEGFLDGLARERSLERTLHNWESRPTYAALALLLVAIGIWLLIDRGIPIAVEHIAVRIPVAAEASLGSQTLAGMDRYVLKPSTLPAERQEILRGQFARMAQVSGVEPKPQLEMRASPVLGPNAFALPSGIIVVTDELVTLARDDREVMAVLAHELGHVRHRDIMRQLLQSSATALVIAGVTGDIVSTTSIAAAAPTVLIQVKNSRESERDADRYALDLLQRLDIDTRHFAAILQRLDAFGPSRGGAASFLSSHPASDDRKALALRASATNSGSEAARDVNGHGRAAVAKSARSSESMNAAAPTLAALAATERPKIIGMLEHREYDELDRVLSAYQAAFESDASTSLQLEAAFAAFEKMPIKLAPNLDEWIALNGSSYSAAVARGKYRLERGLDARGTGWASQTSEAALSEMREHFGAARIDLERSVTLTEKPYLSHRYLLTIARYMSPSNDALSQYQQAIRWAPQSIETRLAYMKTLEPRWKGSYAAMEAYLADSRAELTDPQDVRRLAAQIPKNHGDDAWNAKNYTRALEYYNEAVELDANPDDLCDRALALSELKRYDEAIEDAARSFEMSGPEHRCMRTLVKYAAQATDANRTIELMGIVIDSDPTEHDALVQRGFRHAKAGRQDLAFDDYLRAAKLGNPWAEYEVGRMYLVGIGVKPDRQQAIDWFRISAGHGHKQARIALERLQAGLK